MNDQECIFKRYLRSCLIDKLLADKELKDIKKIGNRLKHSERERMNCLLISMMFHSHITIFATQLVPLKRRERLKKRREMGNAQILSFLSIEG